MTKWLKNALVLIVTTSFLGVLFFGSPLINQGLHTVHEGCPFASNEQGMCPMMSFEHTDYVTSSLLKIVQVIIATIPIVVVGLFIQTASFVPKRRVKLVSLEQAFFSQGILNPKAP